MKNKITYYFLISCSCIGITLAVFLLYEHYFTIYKAVCYINATFNCYAVTKGSISNLFGIPVPFYGLTGYFAILVASILKAKKTILGIAIGGFLFCIRITFIEVFQIHVICPICIACQTDMFLVLCLSLWLNRKQKT